MNTLNTIELCDGWKLRICDYRGRSVYHVVNQKNNEMLGFIPTGNAGSDIRDELKISLPSWNPNGFVPTRVIALAVKEITKLVDKLNRKSYYATAEAGRRAFDEFKEAVKMATKKNATKKCEKEITFVVSIIDRNVLDEALCEISNVITNFSNIDTFETSPKNVLNMIESLLDNMRNIEYKLSTAVVTSNIPLKKQMMNNA